jgi:hypothetical protein
MNAKALFTVITLVITVPLTIAAIVLAIAAILGNPAWSTDALYGGIKDFQTIIGGALALAGIWLGFHGNRRRDERLRRQEARALALALYGELTAALITCRAFVSQVTAATAKTYDNDWLDKEITVSNLAPRVRTTVFEANADKLGLLGEPLVGGTGPEHHLVVEIVSTFDQLRDYARLADKEIVMTRRKYIQVQASVAHQLREDFLFALVETGDIIQAYIRGGLPAATNLAQEIMPGRKARQDKLGRELGIVPAMADQGESES